VPASCRQGQYGGGEKMNKVFRKVLITLVDEGMKLRFPEFSLDKFDKNPLRKSVDREFLWSPVDGCRIYISILMHHSGWDSFYNEIRWSRLGRYPHLRAEAYSRESIGVDEAFLPVGELCGKRWSWDIKRQDVPPPVTPIDEYDDYRGLTEDEAGQIIRPLVDEMFETLEHCGKPFIAELAECMRQESLSPE
jgi:hypothetical protein